MNLKLSAKLIKRVGMKKNQNIGNTDFTDLNVYLYNLIFLVPLCNQYAYFFNK